jgi:hypothetical protein
VPCLSDGPPHLHRGVITPAACREATRHHSAVRKRDPSNSRHPERSSSPAATGGVVFRGQSVAGRHTMYGAGVTENCRPRRRTRLQIFFEIRMERGEEHFEAHGDASCSQQ